MKIQSKEIYINNIRCDDATIEQKIITAGKVDYVMVDIKSNILEDYIKNKSERNIK